MGSELEININNSEPILYNSFCDGHICKNKTQCIIRRPVPIKNKHIYCTKSYA